MSNDCALMTEKRTEQKFNYMTAKLIKYNIYNEYSSSSAVKNAFNYKRIEKDKKKDQEEREDSFYTKLNNSIY